MSRSDNDVRITPSVLDRLIDYEPEMSREAVSSRAKSLRQMKQSVRRDLEWLLNTRRMADDLPADLKEVANSLLAYGLPDFTAVNTKSPADQGRLRRALETAVTTFEPRLEDVSVTIVTMRDLERVLRFRIDARLRIDPAPEPVSFDTLLQLGSGQYVVQGE
jgi:type VI secretion system protein ImpF